MVVPNSKIWKAHEKQELLANAVFSGIYQYILFGGGIRGGKTVGALKILYALCKIFPGSRWAVVRESGATLRRTTIPSFWASCPFPFFHPDRFNKQDLVAYAANGSQIMFMAESFSEDPELLRFGGLEINGALCEEGNELQKETFYKLIERSGSWNIPGREMPDPLVMVTCNPHQGYLKDIFYTPWLNGTLAAPYLFIPSLLVDNKDNLNTKYLQSLETLKTRSPGLYRRMVLGSWDAEDNIDQLVSWIHIYACENALILPEKKGIKSLGVDCARHGADASVWEIMEDFNCVDTIRIDTTTGPELCEKTERIIIENNIPHDRTFIDTVGLGGYAYDFLRKNGFSVQEFVAGATPVEQFTDGGFKFKNLRSQAGWNVKLGIEAGKAGNIKNEMLKQDLAAQSYSVVGDKKILLASKDELKKRLGRSPDNGDAYIMAYWGQIYDQITPAPDFLVM